MPRYEARSIKRELGMQKAAFGFSVIWDTKTDEQLVGLWEEYEDACIVAERMNRDSDNRGKFREQRV